MKITWFGHACFLVEVKGINLLFDPFISGNPLAKDVVDIDQIKADYILISHGHGDHFLDTERIVKSTNALVIANNEIIGYLGDRGISKGHPFNTGGSYKFDFGTVKFVYAAHSSVMPDGTFAGIPGGFIVHSDEGNFYFAGDTGLTYEMKLIGNYHKIDFALLPIGGNFTMDADDALIASYYIKCNKIIGMHYNTWDIIKIDTQQAIDKFKKAEKELVLFNIGETKEL
jgi:L-ascorbate metabolism protein UlaG (beta-lactamase superfamily)